MSRFQNFPCQKTLRFFDWFINLLMNSRVYPRPNILTSCFLHWNWSYTYTQKGNQKSDRTKHKVTNTHNVWIEQGTRHNWNRNRRIRNHIDLYYFKAYFYYYYYCYHYIYYADFFYSCLFLSFLFWFYFSFEQFWCKFRYINTYLKGWSGLGYRQCYKMRAGA